VYRDVGYALIHHLVLRQLQLDQSSVIDCVVRQRALDLWSGAANAAGVPVHVVECTLADEAAHRSRIEGRQRGIPNWDELDWRFVEMSRRSYVPLQGDKLVVDACRPFPVNLDAVRHFVGLAPEVAT
jgi:hypothetical protein